MDNRTFAEENTFLVGSARASVWVERSLANAAPVYRLSVERRCEAGEQGSWTTILRIEDVTPAILALKKAHDFIKHNAGREPAGDRSGVSLVPYTPPLP